MSKIGGSVLRSSKSQWYYDTYIAGKPNVGLRKDWKRIEDSKIYIITPFNEEFVKELKNLIPLENRLWNREEKRWEIESDADFETVIDKLASKYYVTGPESFARFNKYKAGENEAAKVYKIPYEIRDENTGISRPVESWGGDHEYLSNLHRSIQNTQGNALWKSVMTREVNTTYIILTVAKDGFYLNRHSGELRSFAAQWAARHDAVSPDADTEVLPEKFKEVKWSKTLESLYNLRKDDVVNLSLENLVSLSSAFKAMPNLFYAPWSGEVYFSKTEKLGDASEASKRIIDYLASADLTKPQEIVETLKTVVEVI